MLTPFVPDTIWTRETDFKPGGFELGARATVVRTGSGLCLVSPVGIDDATQAAIDALGELTTIVAPSKLHYRFVPDAHARWPRARVLGAPGLKAKRPELPITGELTDGGHEIDASLDQILVGGMPYLGEMLLWHGASRTLIATDLFFNVLTRPRHWLTRLYLGKRGIGGPAMTRLLRFVVRDKAALRRTRDQLLALAPERVVLSHSSCVTSGGSEAIRTAMAWLGEP